MSAWLRVFLVGLGFVMGGAAATWAFHWPQVHAADRGAANGDKPTPQQAIGYMEQIGLVFEQVADQMAPAVVYVESRQMEGKEIKSEDSGSGVIIRPKKNGPPVILTNLHVLGTSRREDIDVYLADGRMFHPKQIWKDPDTDIALLEPPYEDLATARLGDSDAARVGQWVLVVGSPFGLTQSVTHGIVSARNRRQVGLPNQMRIKEFLQTDAAINPGNSGGPLVNLNGSVIGINTAIASKTGGNSGVGFAIPSNLIRWVAEELVTHGKVRRAFLGVQFPQRYSAEQAVELGLPVLRGALIARVHPNSPAAGAGIRPGDVVLEFDGQPVDDENHLINVVGQTPIGKRVPLVVWRDKARATLSTILGNWDEQPRGE